MLFKRFKANKFTNALSNAIEIEEREKKVMRHLKECKVHQKT